jgi:hypothetical protein
MKPSEEKDKPIFQCMALIMTRSLRILNDLDPDIFENAENFGETTKERDEYTFPMDTLYIAEMQEKEKRLMTEIKKGKS